MIQSIFYKEWIKTRRIVWLIYAVTAGMILYIFLKTSQAIRLNGAVQLWETIVQKDFSLVSLIEYLPLMAGIILALSQYTAEMQNKRFKLTLHLPLSESRILTAMLLYGIITLSILFVATELIILTGLSLNFPKEIVIFNFWKSIPWFLAGIAGYLICSWICLEPVWKQRIINAIPGISALSFFFLETKSGGFIPFLPYLIVFIIISFFFSFYSTIRFKEGAQ